MEQSIQTETRSNELELQYDHFVKTTVFPDGRIKVHEPSIKREEIIKVVHQWRKETDTF